jgi:hypothetical protein
MKKPTSLEFRVKDKQLFGFDRAEGTDYKISWCGNGAYSHYVLTNVSNSEIGWYVYVNDKDPLYRAIYEAEMRMIYEASLCQVCKSTWIGNEYTVCHHCTRREREAFKRSKNERSS